jgi:hypothetical protein
MLYTECSCCYDSIRQLFVCSYNQMYWQYKSLNPIGATTSTYVCSLLFFYSHLNKCCTMNVPAVTIQLETCVCLQKHMNVRFFDYLCYKTISFILLVNFFGVILSAFRCTCSHTLPHLLSGFPRNTSIHLKSNLLRPVHFFPFLLSCYSILLWGTIQKSPKKTFKKPKKNFKKVKNKKNYTIYCRLLPAVCHSTGPEKYTEHSCFSHCPSLPQNLIFWNLCVEIYK